MTRIDVGALRTRLRSDLVEAMRSDDSVRTSVIRTLSAAFANGEAVPSEAGAEPVPFGTAEASRLELDDARGWELLRAEIDDRLSVVADYERHPDAAHAAALRAEIDVLEGYLDEFVTGR